MILIKTHNHITEEVNYTIRKLLMMSCSLHVKCFDMFEPSRAYSLGGPEGPGLLIEMLFQVFKLNFS